MADRETQSDRELLIRLDERLVTLQRQLEDRMRQSDAAVITLRHEFVTKAEFMPVQRAVYAAIGFIVIGVFGGFLTMLLKGVH